MMHEIVKARNLLSTFIEDANRTIYNFKRECIEKSLYGVDIDPGAVEIAKLRLWLSLVVDEEDIGQIKPLPNLDYKIFCGNSLLNVEKNLFNNELFAKMECLKPLYFDETNPTQKQEYKKEIESLINEITEGRGEFDFEVYLSEVFHERGGFDVVIANPPYIGEKGNEEIFHKIARTELGKKFYSRWMDYFYYFFHRSLDICNAGGCISFITTNYYLTATGGKKLRGDFKQRSIVKNLINFNELRIFETAKGQHNMLTILQRSKGTEGIARNCLTHRRGNSSPQILTSIFSGSDTETYYYSIPQAELFEGQDYQIRLAGQGKNSQTPIEPILAKMKSQPHRVGDVCHVLMGLVSRADKVNASHFKTDPSLKAKKGDGIFVLTSKELKHLRLPKEEIVKYVRPFYKNSDIDKYYCSRITKLWLLYMKDEGKPISLSKEMKAHFSKYEKLLTKLKENFLKNEIASAFVKRWLANGNYFVLFNPKKEEYFTASKIIAPYRSKRNTFAYNEIPWFASQDVCYILPQSLEFEIKYLLAILNSNLCFKWLQFKGKRKGDILELYNLNNS
ncbi:MAG: Eco57I restriction-modification methylase domain-containing protein, partial [bacterium]